ncbi:hypothetical protein JG688_00018606 [Phytophthora aleatoria]|uniref:DDE-1 domain-containing protein n=1 Tax=Phytophthora aleatoria TaxID=2496075 RepID=A0A8J5MAZ6_9STRA|nr:hypothetical protein JG688_00018606 [Phytophthora aleatoria]
MQWIEFLLGQVRSTAGAARFKITPSTRPDIIQWIKPAWASLTTSTILGGFKKARILEADQAEHELSHSESDWEALICLLQQGNVPVQTIDSSKDIEQDDAVEEDDEVVEWSFD